MSRWPEARERGRVEAAAGRAARQGRDWQTSAPIPLEELKAYYDLIPAGVERVCFAAVDPGDIPLIARIIKKNRDE